MAAYFPNSRKPLENLQQEMDYSRGRPLNSNLDINLPNYAIDNAIIRAISRDNFSYVLEYLRKCPTNTTRYLYEEIYTSKKPVQKTITICSLLYYAFKKKSMESIRVLVQNGARPLQPSYVVQWGSLQSGEPAIEIVEKPNVAWLAELFITGELELTAQVFKQLKMAGTDLGLPIETRVQKLQQPHPNSTKTTQFVDVWECIEKEVERISTPANLPNAKINLKKIHTAYNTDKLEALYKKPKKGKKSKSNTAASEQS